MECPRCNQVSPDAETCPSCGWPAERPAAGVAGRPDPVTGAALAAQAAAQAGGVAVGAPRDSTERSPDEPSVPGPAAIPEAASDTSNVRTGAGEPETAREQENNPQPGGTHNEFDLRGKTRTLNVVNGNLATIIDSLTINQQERTPEPAKAPSLLDITSELRPDDRHRDALDAVDVAFHTGVLREERLLLISCPDLTLARAAVQAVVKAIEAESGRARLLNFDKLSGDKPALTVHDLLKCRGEEDTETIVVADAVSLAAQPFLDSLVGVRGLWSPDDVTLSLRERGMRLICVAEPQRFAALVRAGEKAPFPHWEVPFLEPLLRRELPHDHEEVRATIVQQRAEGRWSHDDDEFWHELQTLAAQERLREVVDAGGVPRRQPVEVDDQQPVHQAVRFAGAYFTRLNPADFDRVVVGLLGDASIPVPLTTPPGADGAAAEFRDKPLTQLWRDDGDRIMGECGLMVLRDAEAGRIVEFKQPGTREALRERLEGAYPFRLQAAFAALHETGLLFTGSDAVAQSVVQATAHMTESYPETYGREWVAGILVLARVRTSELMPVRRIVRRFAELLRELSTRPDLRALVEGVLDWFLGIGEFDTVFELVKQLRFVPEFDVFRWLRQLINQGDAHVVELAERFLYRELVAVGEQVYPTLHLLAGWLPAQDRETQKYSPANHVALRLLVEYAARTTARFESGRYGEWPTRFPLLAVSGETVSRDLGLLVRWLLHPGMVKAVRDVAMRPALPRLLAALIAEWTFILFGPQGTPAPAEPGEPGEGEDSPERIFTVLLAEVAAATHTPEGRAVRREMTAYWEEMRQSLVPAPGMARAEREELAWKRGLFRALLLRCRALQTAPATTASSSGSFPAPMSTRG